MQIRCQVPGTVWSRVLSHCLPSFAPLLLYFVSKLTWEALAIPNMDAWGRTVTYQYLRSRYDSLVPLLFLVLYTSESRAISHFSKGRVENSVVLAFPLCPEPFDS